MGSYYYLMAQLPYLIYEQKPPMTASEFKDLAKRLMIPGDAVFLDRLSLTGDMKKTGCDFIDKWQEWERTLRLNLAKQRVIKLKIDKPVTEPQASHDAAAIAIKAIDENSPLEAEILLDKARWHAIEDMAGTDYFHRNTVYAYYLKLLLLERRQVFNAEKGFAEYKSLYASIVESVQKSGEPL